MTPLFSREGSLGLDRIVAPGLICIFDFDGTLSPLVALPEQAVLPPEVSRLLTELSVYARIGIITGRSVTDVRSRLNVDPAFVIGNHGLEGMPGWEKNGPRYEALCRNWKTELAAALRNREGFDAGIAIEDKKYSLSVHYRNVTDRAQCERQLAELLQDLRPAARVIAGKCVFNLLPDAAIDKGRALEYLMEFAQAPAIYAGDDLTDEDAFRLRRSDLLTVRIGCSQDSMAEYCIPLQRDIVRLLRELIDRLASFPQHPGAAR